MASFSTINKAPGVYIQEITLPGPIPGVSTSIAAFVGPAQSGPLLTPTMLTEISQFNEMFGSYIESPYRIFAAHAVNGFFAEGGEQCYFVRVGNGQQAFLNLLDSGNVTGGPQQNTLLVTAQEEGTAGNGITVKVDAANIATTTVVSAQTTTVNPQATLSAAAKVGDTSVTVGAALPLKSGQVVTIAQPAPSTTNENAVVKSASGTTLTFQAGLTNAYAVGSALSLAASSQTTLSAASSPGVTSVSVASAAGFLPGETVNIAQSTSPSALNENAVITTISGTTINFKSALANAYPSGAPFSTAPNTGAKGAMVSSPAAFKPGDIVNLTQVAPGTKNENAVIASMSGSTVTFQSALTNEYLAGSAFRIADLVAGQQQLRVASVNGLEPGSYVTISNNTSTPNVPADSFDVVRVVNPTTNTITLTNGLVSTYPMASGAATVNVRSLEFTLTITSAAAGTETFSTLAMDPRHSRYFDNIVNSGAVDVTLADPPSTTPPPLNIPAAAASTPLASGADDNLKTLATADYHKGIDALKKCADANLICVPDAVATWPSGNSHFQVSDTQDIQAYTIAHCELMQDRFAILDSSQFNPSDVTFTAVQNQRKSMNSNNGYGALYFPWVGISNPFGSGRIYVPPSGHLAGVYATNDNTFGVYEAPANEPIKSALSLNATLNDGEQGPLNEQGINVIRSFPGDGILVWGARTISPEDRTAWRYINVRRLLTYIEKSLQGGTRFAVFEPNNISLWQQVKRLVTDFLNPLWQEGALFGATPEQAFRVRVDATLNTPQVVALGQLIVQVTVVPTHPAEFIVFQVIQDPTGASLQESTT